MAENPILRAIDQMLAEQDRRHAWLYEAGAQIRKWREEDEQLDATAAQWKEQSK